MAKTVRPGRTNYYINRYLPWILLAPVLVHLVIFRYIPTAMAFA